MGEVRWERVVEIAASGGHRLLVVGSRSWGESLAHRLLALLPEMSATEGAAVEAIYEQAYERPPGERSIRRPLRSPPNSISAAGLVGGGTSQWPGEVSLAHHGVLFLAELARFAQPALEALCFPLDEGCVTSIRPGDRQHFPARFCLVATMIPCPCGLRGSVAGQCRCREPVIERHWRRVPERLLDRMDLYLDDPAGAAPAAASPSPERVAASRQVQAERFGPEADTPVNAAMGPEEVRRFCSLDPAGRRLLDAAYERLKLSSRQVQRLLQVARTLADLDGEESIRSRHVEEAVDHRDRMSTTIPL